MPPPADRSDAGRVAGRCSRLPLPLAWRRALIAVVALRAAVGVLAVIAGGLLPGLDVPAVDPVAGSDFAGRSPPPTGGIGLLLTGLERFDALWYLAIAEHGYPVVAGGEPVPGAYAFFPLFPLLVGVVGRALLGRFLVAATVVALVAAVAALAGVHRLIEVETGDRDLAGRALVAVAVFPAAYVLVAPYTEGLFLALSAWAFVAARQGRWGRSGLFAAGAALTRPVGILLVPALLLEAWRQRRPGQRPHAVAWSAALLGAPAGVGAYLLWSLLRTGRLVGPLTAQQRWQRTPMWPHETVATAVETALAAPGAFPGGYHALDLVLFVPAAAAVVWLLARTPRTYGVYAVAHVVLWLVYPFAGRPLMSTYRFALAVAPLGWAFAAWTRRPGVATAWWSVSGGLLGLMTALFVGSYYVF